MKRLFLALTLIISVNYAVKAQNIPEKDYIAVSGSYTHKEMPDSIVVRVSLKDNSSASKSNIAQQEKNMYNELKKIGFDVKKDLKMDNYSTYNQKRNNMTAVKDYLLYMDDFKLVNSVFSALNSIGIMDIRVAYKGLKNYDDILLEVKVKALKDAKKQASTLMESIGSKLGKPLMIESSRYSVNNMPILYRSATMDSSLESNAENLPEIEFKEVEVTATVNAKFEILD